MEHSPTKRSTRILCLLTPRRRVCHVSTFADIVIGWECGCLLPNDNDSAKHRTDTADHSSSALSKKEALDGWECWMFRWTATDLKEKNQNRIERTPHEDRHRATELPGGWRHMVCLSQRHHAGLVRGTAYVLHNCKTSLINSIPSHPR